MEDELQPAGFSINRVNSHIVVGGLGNCRQVWFVVGGSGCRGGFKDLIVALCEVGIGEVVGEEICVLPDELIDSNETFGSSDS